MREIVPACITEYDRTKDTDHVVFLRSKTCGHPKCRETGHRWMKCPKCKTLIVRCGLHERSLHEDTRTHCK